MESGHVPINERHATVKMAAGKPCPGVPTNSPDPIPLKFRKGAVHMLLELPGDFSLLTRACPTSSHAQVPMLGASTTGLFEYNTLCDIR
jgi:hypothetical protein